MACATFKVPDDHWPRERNRRGRSAAQAGLSDRARRTVAGVCVPNQGGPCRPVPAVRPRRSAAIPTASGWVGTRPRISPVPAPGLRSRLGLCVRQRRRNVVALCQSLEPSYWQRASRRPGTLCSAGEHGLGQAPAQGASRIMGAGSRLSPADGDAGRKKGTNDGGPARRRRQVAMHGPAMATASRRALHHGVILNSAQLGRRRRRVGKGVTWNAEAGHA